MLYPVIFLRKKGASSVGVPFPYNSESGAAARFLAAVQANPDDAWAFVSKVHSIDLEALRETIGDNASIKLVPMAVNIGDTKNCRTRSVYIEDQAKNRRLLHLRMVREPDKYGVWKIYCVEQG